MWPYYPHGLTRDWWYIEFLTMWANFNPWEVDFERISALKWKSHQIDHVTEQILFYKHYLMPICPILLNVTHFKYYKIIINCNKLPSATQTLWHKFSDFETLWESFFDPALSQSNVLQCCLNSKKYQIFSHEDQVCPDGRPPSSAFELFHRGFVRSWPCNNALFWWIDWE